MFEREPNSRALTVPTGNRHGGGGAYFEPDPAGHTMELCGGYPWIWCADSIEPQRTFRRAVCTCTIAEGVLCKDLSRFHNEFSRKVRSSKMATPRNAALGKRCEPLD